VEIDPVAGRIDGEAGGRQGKHEATATAKPDLAGCRGLEFPGFRAGEAVQRGDDAALDCESSEVGWDYPLQPGTARDVPSVDQHLVQVVAAHGRPRKRDPKEPWH